MPFNQKSQPAQLKMLKAMAPLYLQARLAGASSEDHFLDMFLLEWCSAWKTSSLDAPFCLKVVTLATHRDLVVVGRRKA